MAPYLETIRRIPETIRGLSTLTSLVRLITTSLANLACCFIEEGGVAWGFTFYVTWGLGYILHPGSLEHANELGRRPVGARPMHPTLSPALVRTRAARGPVAIMISQKLLKAGAEIEWSSLEHFERLELKTAQAATAPSGSTCPTAPAAVGYHLRRHRRC